MTYVIVKEKQTVIGTPFRSYLDALTAATRLFGDNALEWMQMNLRVEENR